MQILKDVLQNSDASFMKIFLDSHVFSFRRMAEGQQCFEIALTEYYACDFFNATKALDLN